MSCTIYHHFRRVVSLESSVNLSIYDKNVGEVEGLQGSLQIPLKSLKNQQLIDQWYNLTYSGRREIGQIRLRLQLVWSRLIYYQHLVIDYDFKMTKIRMELQELEKYLDLINKPFGILLYVEIDSHLLKKIHGEDTESFAQTSVSVTLPRFGCPNTSIRSSIIASTMGKMIKRSFLSKN